MPLDTGKLIIMSFAFIEKLIKFRCCTRNEFFIESLFLLMKMLINFFLSFLLFFGLFNQVLIFDISLAGNHKRSFFCRMLLLITTHSIDLTLWLFDFLIDFEMDFLASRIFKLFKLDIYRRIQSRSLLLFYFILRN